MQVLIFGIASALLATWICCMVGTAMSSNPSVATYPGKKKMAWVGT